MAKCSRIMMSWIVNSTRIFSSGVELNWTGKMWESEFLREKLAVGLVGNLGVDFVNDGGEGAELDVLRVGDQTRVRLCPTFRSFRLFERIDQHVEWAYHSIKQLSTSSFSIKFSFAFDILAIFINFTQTLTKRTDRQWLRYIRVKIRPWV